MSCNKGVGRNSSCQRQLHPVRTVYMISIWAWRYKNMRPTLCVQQNKTSENTALRAQSPATGALVNSCSELWAKAANRKCSASQWLQHLRHCARGECLLAVDFFISDSSSLKQKKPHSTVANTLCYTILKNAVMWLTNFLNNKCLYFILLWQKCYIFFPLISNFMSIFTILPICWK